jgi:hypothetical protein
MDIAELYKTIIKDLRLIRNLALDIKDKMECEEVSVNTLGITPYEKGRLKKTCTRLGRNLWELHEKHGQSKVAAYLHAYLYAIKVSPSSFTDMGYCRWIDLGMVSNDLKRSNEVCSERAIKVTPLIVQMIDSPLSDTPKHMVLFRLTI